MNAKRLSIFLPLIFSVLLLAGCDLIPFGQPANLPSNTLIYDAPVSLTIRSGALLSGTTIAYGGKTTAGAAKVMIAGLEAPKKQGDTLDWEGSPVPSVKLKLTTRVITFDDQSLTVAGTAHIELTDVKVQPGGSAANVMMEFAAPVTYTLAKNQTLPGSNVSFVGATTDAAQFAGLDGFPYRKQLDSLEYNGRVLPKAFLKLDLRLVSFSNDGAVLGGTANVKIETP